MEKMEIIQYFQSALQENVALPVAAMLALVSLIKNSTATTWMELEKELRSGIAMLHNLSDLGGRTKISLGSGCDLFMKYVTRAFLLENTVSFSFFIISSSSLSTISSPTLNKTYSKFSFFFFLFIYSYFLIYFLFYFQLGFCNL